MNLTEASMQALLKLEKLEKADLSGTKCGMLAFPDEQAEKPVFELEKCPLVSPYTTEKQFSPRSFKTLGKLCWLFAFCVLNFNMEVQHLWLYFH